MCVCVCLCQDCEFIKEVRDKGMGNVFYLVGQLSKSCCTEII